MASRNVKKVKQFIRQALLAAGDLTEEDYNKTLKPRLADLKKMWPRSYERALGQFRLLKDDETLR
jgi:hypothetical protein